jgi:hypothetical protein
MFKMEVPAQHAGIVTVEPAKDCFALIKVNDKLKIEEAIGVLFFCQRDLKASGN